jgi:cytochrome c biogenesis protein CcdA
VDIGLVTAFLGGMLAILSPCGALLLPAFFASTVGAGPRLLLHGSIFYLGLLLVLVPLGVGAGAIGTLFLTHRALVIGIASGILVVFGLLQIFGIGFDPARLLPGGQALQQRASSSVGVIKTFLLGSASGIAGFCAGPILGAVLTLAAAQGDLFTAGALLAVYGAGMVVPLLIIAALWGKIGDQGRRRLRGRSFTVLGREFHTTSVITGVLITIVGVVFWATNGLIDMPSLIPTSVSAWVQGRSSILANGWVDLGVILAVAAIALLVWWRSARQKPVSAEPGEHETR